MSQQYDEHGADSEDLNEHEPLHPIRVAKYLSDTRTGLRSVVSRPYVTTSLGHAVLT